MIESEYSRHHYKGKPVLLWEFASGSGYPYHHGIVTYKNKFYLSPGDEDFNDTMSCIDSGVREPYSSFKAAYIAFKLIYGEARAI